MNSNFAFITFLSAQGPWAHLVSASRDLEQTKAENTGSLSLDQAAEGADGVATSTQDQLNSFAATSAFASDDTFTRFAQDSAVTDRDVLRVFDAILEHPSWRQCRNCAQQRTCPILRNRHLLSQPWLQQRVQHVVHLLRADGHSLLISDIQVLVVNALLGQGFELEPQDAIMSCAKIEDGQLAFYPDGVVCSNAYDNLVGLNFTPEFRLAQNVFKHFDLLKLGQFTSKNIDDFLLFERPQAKDLRREFFRGFDLLKLEDRLHASWKKLKNADIDEFTSQESGCLTPVVQEFTYNLQAMRRLSFFNLGAPVNAVGEQDRKIDYDLSSELFTDPYLLSCYPHARDYMRLEKLTLDNSIDELRSDAAAKALVIGLNRFFTGLHSINDSGAVYVATNYDLIQLQDSYDDSLDDFSDTKVEKEEPVVAAAAAPLHSISFFRFQAYGANQPRSLNLNFNYERSCLVLDFVSGLNDQDGNPINIELSLSPFMFECLMKLSVGGSAITLAPEAIYALESFKEQISTKMAPYLETLFTKGSDPLTMIKETRRIMLEPHIKDLLMERDELLKIECSQGHDVERGSQPAASSAQSDEDALFSQSIQEQAQALLHPQIAKTQDLKVECADFILGLNQSLLGLGVESSDLLRITLRLKSFGSPAEFLKQHDLGLCWFFGCMYSSLLAKLTQDFHQRFVLEIDGLGEAPNPLLNFAKFLEHCEQQGLTQGLDQDYNLGQSHQLEFELSLHFKTSEGTADESNLEADLAAAKTNTTQLIWKMEATDLGRFLHHDMQLQLDAHAPLACNFSRNAAVDISKLAFVFTNKICQGTEQLPAGAFICVGGNNEGQELPDFGVDLNSFSLIQKFHNAIQKCLNGDPIYALGDDQALPHDLIQAECHKLEEAFNSLAQNYLQALSDMMQGQLSEPHVVELYEQCSYVLLQILSSHLSLSLRMDLAKVVQSIGLAYELNSKSDDYEFAIATPYHIYSMYQHFLRVDRLCELVGQMLSKHLFISDLQLIKQSMTFAFKKPWGQAMINSPDSSKRIILRAIQASHGYTLYQSVSHMRQAFFIDADEQLSTAVSLMERYVRAHPQVRELFKVVIYDCDNPDVLIKLYKFFCKNEFFKSVNTYIYLVNDDLDSLSHACLTLEQERLTSTPEYTGKIHCFILNTAEVAAAKERLKIKFPHTFLNLLCDDGKPYQFDVGIAYHAFDAQSFLAFCESKLGLTDLSNPVGAVMSNYAYYDMNSKYSQLDLAQKECSWMDMVGWHVLYFLYHGDVSNKLCVQQLLRCADQLKEQAATAYAINCDCRKESDFEDDIDGANINNGVLFRVPVPIYYFHYRGRPHLKKMLMDIHQQTDEIITFDSLLTKYQFYDLNIQLVEHQQPTTGDTNTYVSSGRDAEQSSYFLDGLLTMLEVFDQRNASQKILEKASSISGGLLLHSQIGAIYTQEMMGIVLSNFLLDKMLQSLNDPLSIQPLKSSIINNESEQNSAMSIQMMSAELERRHIHDSITAYFRLDEYAAWFGMQFNEIADLLALNMSMQSNGRYLLRIGLVEAKFYQGNVHGAANKSLKQIKATAESFFAIFSHDLESYTVDRKLRLSQLVTLLQQNPTFIAHRSGEAAIEALRSGHCDVSLCALSCVFIYKVDQEHPMDTVTVNKFNFGEDDGERLGQTPFGMQLIFNEKATKLITDEFLSSDEHRVGTMLMLLQDPIVQDFLDHQLVFPLDSVVSNPQVDLQQSEPVIKGDPMQSGKEA